MLTQRDTTNTLTVSRSELEAIIAAHRKSAEHERQQRQLEEPYSLTDMFAYAAQRYFQGHADALQALLDKEDKYVST